MNLSFSRQPMVTSNKSLGQLVDYRLQIMTILPFMQSLRKCSMIAKVKIFRNSEPSISSFWTTESVVDKRPRTFLKKDCRLSVPTISTQIFTGSLLHNSRKTIPQTLWLACHTAQIHCIAEIERGFLGPSLAEFKGLLGFLLFPKRQYVEEKYTEMGFLSVQHLFTDGLQPTIHPSLVRWRSHSSAVLKEACQEMFFSLLLKSKMMKTCCAMSLLFSVFSGSCVLVPLITVQVERADKGPLCTAAHMSDCSLCHEAARGERILNR